jgi:hypothetical protein
MKSTIIFAVIFAGMATANLHPTYVPPATPEMPFSHANDP